MKKLASKLVGVNDKEIEILRDSGSGIDLVNTNYVDSEIFTGENIWLGTALDHAMHRGAEMQETREFPSHENKTHGKIYLIKYIFQKV